jgi:hypothetical protein
MSWIAKNTFHNNIFVIKGGSGESITPPNNELAEINAKKNPSTTDMSRDDLLMFMSTCLPMSPHQFLRTSISRLNLTGAERTAYNMNARKEHEKQAVEASG